MSKHDKLTAEEMAGFRLNSELLARIEECGRRLGLEPGRINVLDYGCGRGRSVAKLRELGYRAFGVDVDSEPLANGRPYLSQSGLNADEVLRVIGDDGRTDFGDGFFHFVFSEQVIEHVGELEAVLAEIARITVADGTAFHVFSAPHRLIEEHVRMPLVHWLPKCGVRRVWVLACLLCGKDPGWKELQKERLSKRAAAYADYLNRKTFYRSCGNVLAVARKYFLEAEADVPGSLSALGVHRLCLHAARRIHWRLYRWLCFQTVAIRLALVK